MRDLRLFVTSSKEFERARNERGATIGAAIGAIVPGLGPLLGGAIGLLVGNFKKWKGGE